MQNQTASIEHLTSVITIEIQTCVSFFFTLSIFLHRINEHESLVSQKSENRGGTKICMT